jgi:exopolysaccharide biosynthesis polyprenyl glycosylphosphotransferase
VGDRLLTARLFAGSTDAPRTRRRGHRGWLVRRMLVTADVTALLLAFGITELAFGQAQRPNSISIGYQTVVFLLTLPIWIVAAHVYGLYDHDDERAYHSTVDEFVSVFHLITVGIFAFVALSWVTGMTDPRQKKLGAFWLVAILLMTVARVGARTLARRRPLYIQNTIVVGAGTVGQIIGRKVFQHPEYGMNLLGFVDSDPKQQRDDLRQLRLLGNPSDLPRLVTELEVDRVILAFSNERHDEALESIRLLRELDVQIDVVPRLYEALGDQVVFHSVEGLPLLGLPPVGLRRVSRLLKRGIDLVGAGALLFLTLPLFVIVPIAIKLDSRGPVFFRQRRLTMGMREFTVLKFRTMVAEADEAPHREYIDKLMSRDAAPEDGSLYKLARPNDVTRIGALLRKTSLDELPQLLNVLRGDMSLVGPRPCIPYETRYFKPHHFERFRVPAGVTGLWQVAARAHTTFGDALDLDVAYARSWSIGLDLRLLARTPLVIFRGDTETA